MKALVEWMTEEKNITYAIGYVGIIDVLGFGEFTKDEDNFHRTYSLMNHIFYQKRNFERNFEHIKFSVLSDIVAVMIEAIDPQRFDCVFFESVLSHIGLVRAFILNCTVHFREQVLLLANTTTIIKPELFLVRQSLKR